MISFRDLILEHHDDRVYNILAKIETNDDKEKTFRISLQPLRFMDYDCTVLIVTDIS